MNIATRKTLDERLVMLNEQIEQQTKLMKSQLVVTKNVDARIEAIKDLLVAKGVITEDDYQHGVDAKLGLRRKDKAEDVVEDGDIVWVSYVAAPLDDLENKMVEKGLPLRVGSGAVPFEHELVGKQVHLKGHVFEIPFEERTIKFLLDINLVKTKVSEDNIVEVMEQ